MTEKPYEFIVTHERGAKVKIPGTANGSNLAYKLEINGISLIVDGSFDLLVEQYKIDPDLLKRYKLVNCVRALETITSEIVSREKLPIEKARDRLAEDLCSNNILSPLYGQDHLVSVLLMQHA